MRLLPLALLPLLSLAPTIAHADPTGVFQLIGVNPDNGRNYKGTVQVVRTGQTYTVYWKIGGSEFVGTGLGAKFVGNRFVIGPASADDTAISVGYASANSFGLAMYFEQPDGHWQGAWTYGGSQTMSTEDWYRQ